MITDKAITKSTQRMTLSGIFFLAWYESLNCVCYGKATFQIRLHAHYFCSIFPEFKCLSPGYRNTYCSDSKFKAENLGNGPGQTRTPARWNTLRRISVISRYAVSPEMQTVGRRKNSFSLNYRRAPKTELLVLLNEQAQRSTSVLTIKSTVQSNIQFKY